MSRQSPADPLVRVDSLVKHYDTRRGLVGRLTGRPGVLVQALNDVSFTVRRGETLGLIGESGCGKSTLGRAVLRLHEPTAGRVTFDGTDVTGLGHADLKAMRQRMQIVFQDPYASLNPRRTVAEIVGLSLKLHGLTRDRRELRDRVAAIIENVGLKTTHLDRYPHQFSGGQRQRIGIARALILNPDFIVCDEPVSALDVSIQAQIIQLLADLKREMGLTYLFISHDISVIGYVSDRVAVMYLGEIVEMGPVEAVLERPRHPYTQSLLSAVPQVDKPGPRTHVRLKGDLPSPLNPPPGCKFHTRCPLATDVCRTAAPETRTVGDGHTVSCHLVTDDVRLAS
ncbi:ABC transporter ATP-binding protein [Polymorphum gilvum]|uniref:Oligopeptide/dipeptide ABC transporter, ATPase subunit n=1 Tax=Polymorphum gilvum (strain LMG 25793 / CGMCC 1.9160 / SL003B-26A1) TaxID=991905 RepID=F2J4I5_POLGS|nr:dipeptide ABC transporter ATP-binding protein [Polymorphum gilvum]ADZ72238.1 Oligopeptide/dipeptide ABC transporter, ATPase subunit [Polymorphum gilvum SL003B-26A1]